MRIVQHLEMVQKIVISFRYEKFINAGKAIKKAQTQFFLEEVLLKI